VENLVEEVHPATLKREASDRARDFVQGEFFAFDLLSAM
jgi:hypothetical protein